MAKRKNRPQPGQHPQQQVNVDLSKADTMKCEDCGNYLFIQANVIKRISPILSPTGQEALVPVQVYSCGNCGHINRKLNPTLEQDEENNNEKENFI